LPIAGRKQNVRSESLSSALLSSPFRDSFQRRRVVIDTHNRKDFPTLATDTDNWRRPRVEALPDIPDGPRLSWYKPNSVSAFARWRSFVSLGFLSARHRDAGCDYYPRVPSRFPGKASGQPFPLLCLAPHGVFRTISLTLRSGGLLPRLFTLTHHHQLPVVTVTCQLNQPKFAATDAFWLWKHLTSYLYLTNRQLTLTTGN
jgi:hypothetical protein